jgi:hypothetical protein
MTKEWKAVNSKKAWSNGMASRNYLSGDYKDAG